MLCKLYTTRCLSMLRKSNGFEYEVWYRPTVPFAEKIIPCCGVDVRQLLSYMITVS